MRRSEKKRLEAIWQKVEEKPGLKAGRVARELKVSRTTVMRALPAMDAEGLLLSEDERGGLWPWNRQRV